MPVVGRFQFSKVISVNACCILNGNGNCFRRNGQLAVNIFNIIIVGNVSACLNGVFTLVGELSIFAIKSKCAAEIILIIAVYKAIIRNGVIRNGTAVGSGGIVYFYDKSALPTLTSISVVFPAYATVTLVVEVVRTAGLKPKSSFKYCC